MNINEAIKRMRFDTRLVDWNLKHENITQSDIESHLSSLEDCSSLSEKLSFEEETEETAAPAEVQEQPQMDSGNSNPFGQQ